ncbi:MAG: succinate dehydrogenase [Candidatus Thorarchaeota archaeon]
MMEVIHDPNQYLKKSRLDRWWLPTLTTTVVLAVFVVYTTLAILANKLPGTNTDFFSYNGGGAHYVSPIFSPEITIAGWPLSPAFILIWIPLGFRATCYYCRKLYYRSFFIEPAACAVRDLKPVRLDYKGERRFPFILNNLHRYFLYGAIILMAMHWFDFINALRFGSQIGIGIGTILIGLDGLFLTLYVFSCHAFRHFVGGNINQFSNGTFNGIRYYLWHLSSRLNTRHNLYFWLSAISVVAADLYIRLLVSGVLNSFPDILVKF